MDFAQSHTEKWEVFEEVRCDDAFCSRDSIQQMTHIDTVSSLTHGEYVPRTVVSCFALLCLPIHDAHAHMHRYTDVHIL